jgi:hypothetical protein
VFLVRYELNVKMKLRRNTVSEVLNVACYKHRTIQPVRVPNEVLNKALSVLVTSGIGFPFASVRRSKVSVSVVTSSTKQSPPLEADSSSADEQMSLL